MLVRPDFLWTALELAVTLADTPNRNSRTCRNGCFQRFQCDFLCCTAGNVQNILRSQTKVFGLSAQDLLQIARISCRAAGEEELRMMRAFFKSAVRSGPSASDRA
jgi:hypothetical protein